MRAGRRILFAALVVALATSFAAAAKGKATRVPLDGGSVSMLVPEHFTALTPEEIEAKYPRANAPGQVYGNERRTVSVAVSLSPTAMAPEQLPEAVDALGDVMPRLMPGLEWVTRELVTINGRQWVHFAMVTPAVDTKIHNEMFMTSFRGRLLVVNLNATVAEYEAHRSAFAEIRSSLRLALDAARLAPAAGTEA